MRASCAWKSCGAASGSRNAQAIVTTNLLGPIRLTAALLPLLQKQPYSAIMNVSSGLAFVPLAATPTYCATKAALHSYTQSLRYQLRGASTEVLELAPPYVATDQQYVRYERQQQEHYVLLDIQLGHASIGGAEDLPGQRRHREAVSFLEK